MLNQKNKDCLPFNLCKKSIGFTIVELLVVIVVIGILAAITIVSYSGISRRAIAVALQSDLNANAKLLDLYKVDHDVYPDSLDSNYCPDAPVADTRYCLKTSDDNTLTYDGGGQDYTLTITNTPSEITYEISNGGTPTEIAGGGGGSGVKTFANAWGGTGFDQAAAIVKTSDGNFVVAGSTTSFGAGGEDGFIAKYNSVGALTWNKTWGGASEDDIKSMVQTADGGYIVAGNTSSFGAGEDDAYLAKFTADGAVSWSETWGGAGFEYATSVIQTTDDGYVIAGHTTSYGAGSRDAFIVKYTSDGTLSWDQTWGGGGMDYGEEVIQVTDGGYVIAGQTSSFGAGGDDAYIAKFDENGAFLWDKTWGKNGTDRADSITKTSDGGFAIAGYTSSYDIGINDVFIAKYISDGTLSWSTIWGETNNDYAESIIQTSDGGYAVVGESESFATEGDTDAFISKFTSSGSHSWSKSWSGVGNDVAMTIAQTSEGGYIIAGYTASYGAGDSDMFMARYQLNGTMNYCLSPKCKDINPSTDSPVATQNNPAATIFNPSVTAYFPVVVSGTPTATTTVIVPTDPYPNADVVFSAQELYIAYPGESQTVCKEWTAPQGKEILGFYVTQATEQDYDYFTVSINGVEKYNKSGAIADEYTSLPADTGYILSACISADESTQDGFGGEVTGIVTGNIILE